MTLSTGVAPSMVRFGVFEFDPQTQELRRDGHRLRVEGQSLIVLAALLRRPGELVTRHELQDAMWPDGTCVDYEHSINVAVQRLREALQDSASVPHFIETLPRRGYRFVYPMNVQEPPAPPRPATSRRSSRSWMMLAAAVLLMLVAAIVWRSREVASPPHPVTSLAVLPLTNVSGDPAQEFFADGITDALITELNRLGAVRVVSSQSVLRYKASKKSTQEIAHELKVDAVIVGTVLRSGDRVRINLQLVRAGPEATLWSQSFVRETKDVLALQAEISEAVGRRIEAAITDKQRVRLSHRRVVDPAAYDAWLRGNELYSRYSDRWFEQAAGYFEKAIRIDPSFAPPYAGLAILYSNENHLSYDVLYPKASAAAATAMALDPLLPEAHVAEAMVDLRFRWDWAAAEREFRQALELDPNNSRALEHYGFLLVLEGRFDEGIALYRRARQLEPLDFLANQRLAWALGKARRYDEELAQLRELEAIEPDKWALHYALAYLYGRKGMYREALEEAGKINCRSECGWLFAAAGHKREARTLIAEMENAERQRQYVEPVLVAMTYSGLGDKKNALTWLQKGYRRRSRYMIYLKVMEELDTLRSEPGFRELLQRMNLPS